MPEQTKFPKPGEFTIHSVPMFLLSRGERTEVVACKGKLVVRTGRPRVGARQRRQVDVEIVEWVATGTSKLLGGKIEFRQTPGGRLKSSVTAGKNADLPGVARFGMNYQVTTPRGTVEGLTGVASGRITSFPPRGDVFTVQKRLAIGDITVSPIACACARDVVFTFE